MSKMPKKYDDILSTKDTEKKFNCLNTLTNNIKRINAELENLKKKSCKKDEPELGESQQSIDDRIPEIEAKLKQLERIAECFKNDLGLNSSNKRASATEQQNGHAAEVPRPIRRLKLLRRPKRKRPV